ncbi:MAG: hypothetical protein OHK0015_27630 [Chloroflexi bacterium OHK40]
MKRRTRHATRSLLPFLTRRRPAPASAVVPSARILSALSLGGRSAFTLAIAALMLIFIGLLITNFVGQVLQSARLEATRAELEAEVAAIRATNVAIEGAVGFTESDVYVERVAREQLGYAREGDVVLLPRTAPAPTLAPAAAPVEVAAPPPEPVTPNWLRWWRALFPA